MDTAQQVSQELTALLKTHELSLNWAGRRLGISGFHLGRVLKGQGNPSKDMLNGMKVLASALQHLNSVAS